MRERRARLQGGLLAHVALFAVLSATFSAAGAQGRPPLPPDTRTKHCVALYSHNFNRNNPKPIHYRYRWCKPNQSCTPWSRETIASGDSAYVSQIKCYNTAAAGVKLQVRYDWKFRSGYQAKSYDLFPETFPYIKSRLPNSGCIQGGAYHFVSRGDTLYLYRGVPKNVKRISCRWKDSE